jgi:sec-independent protein translocase protein TatB
MSMGELFFIGIIVLLVVPPEKLPGLAREAARFLNEIRRSTSGIWDELKKDVPNPMEDLRKQKQDVEDYLKFIGSSSDHAKDHTHATPVQSASAESTTAPAGEATPTEVATSAPAESTFANKPNLIITSTTEQKNESDSTKK